MRKIKNAIYELVEGHENVAAGDFQAPTAEYNSVVMSACECVW